MYDCRILYSYAEENIENLDFLFLRNEKWVRDSSWKYQWTFLAMEFSCLNLVWLIERTHQKFWAVQMWHIEIGIISGKSRLLGTRLLFYFIVVKKCLKRAFVSLCATFYRISISFFPSIFLSGFSGLLHHRLEPNLMHFEWEETQCYRCFIFLSISVFRSGEEFDKSRFLILRRVQGFKFKFIKLFLETLKVKSFTFFNIEILKYSFLSTIWRIRYEKWTCWIFLPKFFILVSWKFYHFMQIFPSENGKINELIYLGIPRAVRVQILARGYNKSSMILLFL